MKKRNSQTTIIIIVALFLFILGIYIWGKKTTISEVIITLTAIMGAIAIFYEMKRTKDLAEGEFILSLDQQFSSRESFSDLFMSCWCDKAEGSEETITYEKDKNVLLNYLTFFETVYVMVESNVMEISLVDELFARRFFAVVNNQQVQNQDLIVNYKHYINIFKLHAIWKKHRIKHGESLHCDVTRNQRDLQKEFEKKLLKEYPQKKKQKEKKVEWTRKQVSKEKNKYEENKTKMDEKYVKSLRNIYKNCYLESSCE